MRLLQLPADLQQLISERQAHRRPRPLPPQPPQRRPAARSCRESHRERLVGPPDRADLRQNDVREDAQARRRSQDRPQRQSRHPGDGAQTRHADPRQGRRTRTRQNRNRVLFRRRPGPHLRRDHGRSRNSYFSSCRISCSSRRISGNGSSANSSSCTRFGARAGFGALASLCRLCRAPSMVNRFS